MEFNMNNKFTEKAEASLNRAVRLAEGLGHTYIGTEHVLLALSEDESCCAAALLKKTKLRFEKAYQAVKELSGVGEKTTLSSKDTTPRCRRVLESSYRNSRKFSSERIGTEHILLSILEERDSVASRILSRCDVDTVSLKDEVVTFLRTSERNTALLEPISDSSIPNLIKYGRNMTKLAEENKFDPVIGRDAETERVIRILSRKTKNNPCLIGEAGVGKTAIAEGLSIRIAKGDVPASLLGKTVISIDLTSMVAGAKYRGDFEERIKSIMSEAAKNKSVILFIDEIHSIVGAGAAEGAIDASNIMKPELARGEIRVIGATTVSEYRKYIEKDSALERRFQPVYVGEPDEEGTLEILRGLKERYESHHRLKISEEALTSAVRLSKRYIHDRFLPDKAIDLIDEACAMRYTIERDKRNKSEISYDILGQKSELGDYLFTSAPEDIPEKEVPTVTKADVERVILEITGIKAESNLLKNGELYKVLSESVVGQSTAIEKLSSAVTRSLAGINDPDKPKGVFLFVGKSGVGKTELSLALAKALFGSSESLIRYDMSEYAEASAVSKFIGSSPGYVGYDDTNSVLERIRRRPYSVILFDEIEKAHTDVLALFLQIFDTGYITDAGGRKISFKDSYIILTSNHGADKENKSSPGFVQVESEINIYKSLKPYFKDEFLNRIDEIISFSPLCEDSLEIIAKKHLSQLKERAKLEGYDLEFSEELTPHYAKIGRNKDFGARYIKRLLVSEIDSLAAEYIINGDLRKGDILRFDMTDGRPSVKVISPDYLTRA